MGKIGGQSSLLEDIQTEIEHELARTRKYSGFARGNNDPEDHHIYIVQEYRSGGRKWGEPLGEEKARKYFRSCLRAVTHAFTKRDTS